ncbi:hypothetical protein [Candidatus Mesenet endosymbiont of Phosphuga atrata]|uniref:hypothetical protein n=1 Tax=Candidatus Mesenet endosymbiont of Phosphuga atrata TaxID=3066221 RepID=UPI0030D3544A
MLYINNQAIDKTIDINQIIEAIKALPSPFSNLEEDKVIEDKSLFELFRTKIEFLDHLVEGEKRSLISVTYCGKDYDLDSYFDTIKNELDEQKIDYFSCCNILKYAEMILVYLAQSTKLASFYFKDIRDLSFNKFQGKYDKEAHIVAQGEVGFSSNQKMGTFGLFSCIALIIRDISSKKTALIHVDTGVTEDHLFNVLKYMPAGSKKVILMGAKEGDRRSQQNLEMVIKALLKYEHDINIDQSNILCRHGHITSCVVDPITFKIRYLVPKLEMDKEFKRCSQPRMLQIFKNVVFTKNGSEYSMSFNNRFKDRLEYAFDLDVKESYLPIEICKETANSVFNIIKYMNINNNYPFYSVNESCVQNHVSYFAKYAIDNVKNGSYGESSEMELPRVMELYCNALNNLMGAIDKYVSSFSNVVGFLKKKFIRDVAETLKTKKIFIGPNSQELNLEFLRVMKEYELENLSVEEFELQTSKLIGDLKRYQLPFSTDFSDLDGCQKLREFLIRSKAETLISSTKLSEVSLQKVSSSVCCNR